MILEHYRASDVARSGCFEGIIDFRGFLKAVERFGTYAKAKNPLNDQAENKGKGDAFEVFGEFLFRRNGLDGKLGRVKEYHNAPKDQQGVDAFGVNDNNQNLAIQYKFISNPVELIPDDRLDGFCIVAQTKFHVDILNDSVLLIVTTGSNIRYTYEARFGDRKRVLFVINRGDLQHILIENPGFWEEFLFALALSITTHTRTILPLYPHQTAAKIKIDDVFLASSKTRGQILIPPAGGKTRLEAEAVWEVFRNGGHVGLLCVPRLALGRQLLNDFYTNKPADIDMEMIPVASGQIALIRDRIADGEVPAEYEPTTKVQRIKDEILRVLTAGKKALLVSSYQSVERAGKALLEVGVELGDDTFAADIGIADEAHNVVSGEFRKFLDDTVVPIKKRLFFTATRKTSFTENGKGMNNSAQFGEVVYSVKPIELIKNGIIASPKIHVLDYGGYASYIGDFATDLAERTKLNLSMIIVGVAGHLEKVNNDGRVIVFCKSAEEAAKFCNPETKENKNLRRFLDPSIKMFCITSDYGRFHSDRPDDKEPRRDDILRDFRKAQKAIFFHYNIISEGIDIPAVTGVLFLRGVDRIMTIQATGRTLRLHDDDKDALREGRIRKWTDDVTDSSWTNGWRKPYGWVIVPRVQGFNVDEAGSLVDILKNLVDYGFEFDARIVEHDQIIIAATLDAEDTRSNLSLSTKQPDLFDEIKEMVAQIRQEEIELMIRPRAFVPVDTDGIADEQDEPLPPKGQSDGNSVL